MRFTQGRPSAGWNYQQDFGTASGLTFGRVARHFIGAGFGALLGAGAMYLLDPEMGSDRRHRLADAANDTLDHASDAIRDTAHYARDRVSDAGSAIMDRGSSLAEAASASLHAGRTYFPQLRRLSARRSKGHIGSAPLLTLSGLGLLAAGAGAMWLFDAKLGRGRRAWIGQKAARAARETGCFMRSTGRHLRNKARGYTHRASNMARRRASGNPSARGSDPYSGEIEIEAITYTE